MYMMQVRETLFWHLMHVRLLCVLAFILLACGMIDGVHYLSRSCLD